jgi:hypothetical protein
MEPPREEGCLVTLMRMFTGGMTLVTLVAMLL